MLPGIKKATFGMELFLCQEESGLYFNKCTNFAGNSALSAQTNSF